jgi:Protein of unknown function (DUF4232)
MNAAKLGIGSAAAAAVMLLAGCMVEGHAATSGTSTTPADVPVSSPSASPLSTGGSAPSAAAAAPARCHTRDLAGHVEGRGAGAGQRYANLGLTNKTSTPCTIYGYPGLQLVDAHGTALPTRVQRDTAVTPRQLLVKPRQTVWALLHWTVVPADDEATNHCAPDPASLRVIPPDETTQLTVAFDYGAVCQHGELIVDPFSRDRLG